MLFHEFPQAAAYTAFVLVPTVLDLALFEKLQACKSAAHRPCCPLRGVAWQSSPISSILRMAGCVIILEHRGRLSRVFIVFTALMMSRCLDV